MKTFLFKKLNLNLSVKEELLRITDKVKNVTLELENLNEENIHFFRLESSYDVFTVVGEHLCKNISKASWQTHLDNGTITKQFLDKFKFSNMYTTLFFNKDTSFRYHRHSSNFENEIIPYQIIITRGKSTLEFVNPLDFNDTVTDPRRDMFGTLPLGVETKIIENTDCNHLEVYIMNGWIYHTLNCNEPVSVSVWHPPARNIYEAYDYIRYIEALQ